MLASAAPDPDEGRRPRGSARTHELLREEERKIGAKGARAMFLLLLSTSNTPRRDNVVALPERTRDSHCRESRDS